MCHYSNFRLSDYDNQWGTDVAEVISRAQMLLRAIPLKHTTQGGTPL